MSPQRRLFVFGALACLSVIGITLVLVLTLLEDEQKRRNDLPGVQELHSESGSGGTNAGNATPRRVPIAGAAEHSIVIYPDGSSYLEGPEGLRKQLSGPTSGDAQTVADEIARRLDKAPPKKQGLRQLVVCERGAVNLPDDAVITFVGSDCVVAINPKSGIAAVYYIDGRIEQRNRALGRTSGEAGLPPARNSKD